MKLSSALLLVITLALVAAKRNKSKSLERLIDGELCR